MLISTVVNIVVSKMLFKVGKEADSVALQADAWRLRTDVYTAAGVTIGFALIWMGHQVQRSRYSRHHLLQLPISVDTEEHNY